MIDLKEFALVSGTDATAVHVQHLTCGDKHPVLLLDDALQWVGDHHCGQ